MATTYNQGIKLSHTGAQVDSALTSEEATQVATTAAMVAAAPPTSKIAVVPGSGLWAWVEGDETTPDNTYVLASTVSDYADAGRWKLVSATTDGVLDAQWFGVVADYSTTSGLGTDNTVALESAIAAASASGRELILPAGDILVTGTLSIPVLSAFIMRGAGKWKTKIYAKNVAGTALTAFLNLNGVYASTESARVELRDFSIWGDNDSDIVGIYISYGSHFVKCENVLVTGFYDGWRLADCWNMSF
ncbi:MAG: hypothetical protein KDB29_12600, partial [Planctomycetes bacterium]|nr:hypothetical protein [Planctomycetota bacterium]